MLLLIEGRDEVDDSVELDMALRRCGTPGVEVVAMETVTQQEKIHT